MNKNWYIIQLIAGYEEKVRDEIYRRIKENALEDQFGEVLIPEVKAVKNYFNVIDNNTIEQLFPGYMVISLIPLNENFRLVSTIPRVIRFLGGSVPAALSQDEVDRILSQVSGKIAVVSSEDAMYHVGEAVDIIEGPFSGFSGVVNSIDDQKKRMVVMISIFNRLTPIEIAFNQAKK
jgi:transcriptional antiterminator NusG